MQTNWIRLTLGGLLLSVAMMGCSPKTESQSPFADEQMWYSVERGAPVDVFYVVSTNVATAYDADSVDTYRAWLTEADRELFKKEMRYIAGKFDDMNTYSPYYHQYTLSSLMLPESDFAPVQQAVVGEVCQAFDYYLEHYNQGRPFVLCGFSQGAMHLLELLRHIDDATYCRCVAAYVLGYRLSADDVAHPHINPATDEVTPGVTISFNSVNDTTSIWHRLADGAVTCINPVNWRTDAEPAQLDINDAMATIHVDQDKQVLIVKGLQPELYYIPGLKDFCPVGNYHLGDLIFYSRLIAENAAKRAEALSASGIEP